jgi:hypothetical protein
VKFSQSVLRSAGGAATTVGKSAAKAAFQASTSKRSFRTVAGSVVSPSRICWISGIPSPSAAGAGGGAEESASRYRCSRSAWSSRSVRATAARTWVLALIGRPCSSQVYQVTPTPES